MTNETLYFIHIANKSTGDHHGYIMQDCDRRIMAKFPLAAAEHVCRYHNTNHPHLQHTLERARLVKS